VAMVLWVNFSDAPATVILIAIIHCQTRKNSVIFDYNCTGTHLAKQVALHYMHQIVRIEMTSIYQIQPVRQSQTPGTFSPVSLASSSTFLCRFYTPGNGLYTTGFRTRSRNNFPSTLLITVIPSAQNLRHI